MFGGTARLTPLGIKAIIRYGNEGTRPLLPPS